ncbi:MAG: hypothetical protein RSF90_03155, partial [Pygmaiobacter sp.]
MKKLKEMAASLWQLAPLRHLLLVLSLVVLVLFWVLRRNRVLMQAVIDRFAIPFERGMAKLCSYLPFSVAELCWAVLIFAALLFAAHTG